MAKDPIKLKPPEEGKSYTIKVDWLSNFIYDVEFRNGRFTDDEGFAIKPEHTEWWIPQKRIHDMIITHRRKLSDIDWRVKP